jgi:hypothetical protein
VVAAAGALFLLAAPASATIVDFAAALPVGDFGFSSYVDPTTGVVATGLYLNTSAVWSPADLYVRNDPDDHGLGVCNPVEKASAPCPGPTSGGDVNELDNMGQAELIRLTLPAGWEWVSVQLSSLDDNSTGNPESFERGLLWTGNFADPGLGFDTAIWLFEGSGTVEPSFAIPAAYSTAPFLFFEPFDWFNEGLNENNDFLVWRVELRQVRTPEPGSLAVLALGLLTMAVLRRKPR